MNSRRYFLMQGTLAACTLTYLNLFNKDGLFNGMFAEIKTINKKNKLTILHGNDLDIESFPTKSLNQDVLKLTTPNTAKSSTALDKTPFPVEVIKKGKINIGVIYLDKKQFNNDNAQHVADLNKTALMLKE